MNLPSDFVTTYRQQLGILLLAREKLRAMGRTLNALSSLLDNPEAFAGTNADLVKADIENAKTVLDSLDSSITTGAEGILYKVAGNNALPK